VIRNFNGVGIWIQSGSTGNTIAGNYIGALNTNGLSAGAAESNNHDGILIEGSANHIGSPNPLDRNVLSGNIGAGISIVNGAGGNLILGNYIGLDATGATVLSNADSGIYIESSNGNTIGGQVAGSRNLISGNVKSGIYLSSGASNTVIQGNYVGVDASGILPAANNTSDFLGFSGITLGNANGTLIGGTSPGSGNLIWSNNQSAISVDAGLNNAFLGNSTYLNTALGINLGGAGVTANDLGDADLGANGLQNYPTLISANSTAGNTAIVGTLNSTANTTYRIEFFSSAIGDPSGHGQGQTYLGFVNVSTDAGGNANFTALLGAITVPAGYVVSATATVEIIAGVFGNTSEFSQSVVASATLPTVLISPVGGLSTREAGANTTFGVSLSTAPVSNVVLTISSTDTTEGTPNTSTITFTSANWNIPQIVTINPVDDLLVDGDVSYQIGFGVTTTDPGYAAFTPSSITVVNLDNETLTISGTVYEDVNGDGGVGDASTQRAAGVLVRLYRDTGNGIADATDAFVASINTDALGNYAFSNLGDAQYFVSFDSKTVTASAGYNAGFTNADAWAQQSFFSAGSQQFNLPSGLSQTDVDSDDATNLATANHYSSVILAGANVAGVSAGFSFTTITTGRDGDDVPSNPLSVQGSLRQFIQNSNAIVGQQTSQFRIAATDANFTNGIAVIQLTASLPAALDTINLDARTQTNWGGNTNAGVLGSSGTVGTGPTILTYVEAPEVELRGVSNSTSSLDILGANSILQGFAILGGGTSLNAGTAAIRVFGNGTTVQGNVFGTHANTLTDPGASSRIESIALRVLATTTITNNIIAYIPMHAISLEACASNSVVSNNEIINPALLANTQAGIAVRDLSNLTISGNLIRNSGANAIELYTNVTNSFVYDNTFRSAGLLGGETSALDILSGSNNNVITRNSIELSAGVGIRLIGANGNALLGNQFVDNTGIAIDLNDDGITPNDSADPDSGANGLQNYPVLLAANSLAGDTIITGTLNSTPNTTYALEFYSAPAAHASGHGEGRVFLGLVTLSTDALGNANFSATLFGVSVIAGHVISATATVDLGGGIYRDTSEFSATVICIANSAPVHAAPAFVSPSEDVVFSFTGVNTISVNDVNNNVSSVQLSVGSGVLSVSLVGGASINLGANGSNSLRLVGSQVQINAALSSLSYLGATNFSGADTLTLVSTDLVGATTSTAVLVNVSAVNDPPTSTDQVRSNAENSSFVFSPADFPLIDSADSPANTLLGIWIGTLPTTGLLTLSGVGITPLQFVSAAQLAAGNLVYTPLTNENGINYASFEFRIQDNAGTANGGVDLSQASYNFRFDVTGVNNPPILAPVALTIAEGGTVVLTNANVSSTDVDHPTSALSFTINALTHGQFEFVSASGVGILSFTQADIDAGLVQFVHDGSEFAPTFGLTVSDGFLAHGPIVASVVFTASNDVPSILYTAGTFNISEDNSHTFSAANGNAITLSDPDAANTLLELTLSSSTGSLALSSLAGITFTNGSNSSGTMSVRGTLADLNAALNGLSLTPGVDFNGPVSFNLSIDDLAGGPLSSSAVIIGNVAPVNDAPTLILPASQVLLEDTNLVLGGANRIQVQDGDLAGGLMRLSLSVNTGTLTLAGLAGLTFLSGDGLADNAMIFEGSLGDINAALDGLNYLPDSNFTGAVTLTITSNDLGGTGSGGPQFLSSNLALTVQAVNDAPVSSMPTTQVAQEDSALTLLGANAPQVSDIDALTLQVTLSTQNGTLTLAGLTGLSFTQGDGLNDTSMQFSGTQSAINAALNGLNYLPNLNFNGADQITVLTQDLGGTGSGGNLSQSSSFTVNVQAVNDGLSISAPSSVSALEDTVVAVGQASTGYIVLSDPDAGIHPVRVTLSVQQGALRLGSSAGVTVVQGNVNGDVVLQLEGLLSDINAALQHLVLTPAQDFVGNIDINVSAEDLGGQPGSGPAATANQIISAQFSAVNDAPTITLSSPSFLVTQVGAGQAIVGQTSINDVDSTHIASALVTIGSGYALGNDLLYVENTQIDAATLAAITSTWNSNTGQLQLTGVATKSQYAAVLSALRFATNSASTGSREISISVNDGAANSSLGTATGNVSFSVIVVVPPAPVEPPVVGTGTGNTSDNTDAPATTTSSTTSTVPGQKSAEEAETTVDEEADQSERKRRTTSTSTTVSSRANEALQFGKQAKLQGVSESNQSQLVSIASQSLSETEIASNAEFTSNTRLREDSGRRNRLSEVQESKMIEELAQKTRVKGELDLQAGAAQATTVGMAAFATLLIWTVRASGVVAAIATSSPTWGNMDPLPLLLEDPEGLSNGTSGDETQHRDSTEAIALTETVDTILLH
jgi:parallel beta-helix repeat protein